MANVDQVNLDNHPDYMEVVIPDDKARTDYSWQQRRAELLQAMIRKGHPRLNQSQFARKYDVSQQQIYEDLQVLKAYMAENIDRDFKAWTSTLLRGAIESLVDKGEEERAVRVLGEWKEFLFDTGRMEKEPEKHEVTQSVDIGSELEQAYQQATQRDD